MDRKLTLAIKVLRGIENEPVTSGMPRVGTYACGCAISGVVNGAKLTPEQVRFVEGYARSCSQQGNIESWQHGIWLATWINSVQNKR